MGWGKARQVKYCIPEQRTLGDMAAGLYQLGELRLFSMGEISESGRPADILNGDELGVALLMRSGCTCGRGGC